MGGGRAHCSVLLFTLNTSAYLLMKIQPSSPSFMSTKRNSTNGDIDIENELEDMVGEGESGAK